MATSAKLGFMPKPSKLHAVTGRSCPAATGIAATQMAVAHTKDLALTLLPYNRRSHELKIILFLFILVT